VPGDQDGAVNGCRLLWADGALSWVMTWPEGEARTRGRDGRGSPKRERGSASARAATMQRETVQAAAGAEKTRTRSHDNNKQGGLIMEVNDETRGEAPDKGFPQPPHPIANCRGH